MSGWQSVPYPGIVTNWELEAGEFTLAIFQIDDEVWWGKIVLCEEIVDYWLMQATTLDEAQKEIVAKLREILDDALAAIDGEDRP